jgi:hypothetical protein
MKRVGRGLSPLEPREEIKAANFPLRISALEGTKNRYSKKRAQLQM